MTKADNCTDSNKGERSTPPRKLMLADAIEQDGLCATICHFSAEEEKEWGPIFVQWLRSETVATPHSFGTNVQAVMKMRDGTEPELYNLAFGLAERLDSIDVKHDPQLEIT